MRRKDREIVDRKGMESVIRKASVCHLAMCDGGSPYVVPLCFGYEDGTLYFHSAAEGRKLEVLRRNDRVCFEISVDHEIMILGDPCHWDMRYRCVIGFGRASFIEDQDEKHRALDAIVAQYTAGSFTYPEDTVKSMVVIRVEIESMTGKTFGF
jgi:nitroimidazol reductase NimA-like FMN-containing flavoprotein (pyridoxamine 5'-phosphate oxidase superfamily)